LGSQIANKMVDGRSQLRREVTIWDWKSINNWVGPNDLRCMISRDGLIFIYLFIFNTEERAHRVSNHMKRLMSQLASLFCPAVRTNAITIEI